MANDAGGWIEFDTSNAHDLRNWSGRRLPFFRTAQDGPNPRDQLARIKRLGQVIVCPNLEANDSINVFSPCCQQKHRYARGRTQAAKNFEPVDPRQHDIENNQHVIALRRAGEASLTVMLRLRFKALGGEILSNQAAEFHIIVDDQDAIHYLFFTATG